MCRAFAFAVLCCVLGTGVTVGQEPAPKPTQQTPASPPTEPGRRVATGAPQEKLSDAERIARLQRTIEEDQQRLSDLKAKVDDPEGEYSKAEAEFTTLDKELDTKRKSLEKLQQQGKSTEAGALQTELGDLQTRWKLAKDRFDLAIQDRKTLQQQITTLEQKLAQDREALNKLKAPPSTQPAVTPAQAPTTTPAQPPQPEAPAPAPPQTPPEAKPTATPAPESLGPEQATPPATLAVPLSPEQQKAEEEARTKEAEAETAEEALRSITERIEKARAELELAKTRLRTARSQVENADETRRVLSEQVQQRSSEGAPQAELQELWGKIAEARQRYRAAKTDVSRGVEEVDRLQDQVDRLQKEHIQALQEAEEARQAADDARVKAEESKSPFAPHNLLKWAAEHGPVVIGILLAMIVLLWLARVGEKRIVRILAGPGTGPEAAERENRARTLVSVFHNAANLLIIIGGIVMILDELGVPVAPLLGGAAVIGLAVAFGAQSLVRDYFCGFMILLENQYGINDVIKVGDIGGLVERVTLRVTVLRGLDGTVHFIPNGQIDKVSNMTHGWSRALFEIGVAYKEDVDQVMDVLVKLGKELRADPTFRQLILDNPEMLGVDSFGDSAVVIKFYIKTRPLQQWTVKRAMLRRIKKKFDELGIEIPFPYRTIYHRYEHGEPPGVQQIAATTPPG